MSKRYPHDCDHDYQIELIEAEQLELHLDFMCKGAPECGYCLDEQQVDCECWDVHDNLNLTKDTCQCTCH